MPPFHVQIYDALADDSLLRLVVEAPRGFAKSTVLSKIYPLYLICEGRHEEIQSFSASGGSTGLSTKWLDHIKKELDTNELLRYDYGIKHGNHWGQDHIQIKRGDGFTVDLYCRGKGSSARGSRGVVFIDDPQDAADVRSETVLAGDEDWLFSDVIPILLGDQRLIFIGTSMSPLSLLTKAKQIPGWTVLEFPARLGANGNWDPYGHSIWPEMHSDEFLDAKLAEIGLDRFNAEYMCRPRVSGNPVFKPEWFRAYDPQSVQFKRLEKEGLYTVTGFDGAESKADSADNTAIVTLSTTYNDKGNIYVRECLSDHWSTKEGAEQLLLAFDRWQQHKTIVESRCKPPNKDAIIEEIEERQRIYHKYINMYQVKPDRDKVRRAMGVQSIVQQGRVYFDMNDKGQQALISELTMFTGKQGFHDDKVDAYVYGLTDIKDWHGQQKDRNNGPIIIRSTKSGVYHRQTATGVA